MIIKKVKLANVYIWDQFVGAVAWNDRRGRSNFQYDPDFVRQGLEIAPIMMPLNKKIYSFPELKEKTFHGLPGMLADALPDRFGNSLIDIWLKENKRDVYKFTPVERLCYMGMRGMGALEFKPAYEPRAGASVPIEVSELVGLANQILYHRNELNTNFFKDKHEAIKSIIRAGTSAGGNRAKAVIAWNPKTGEVRSGQVKIPEGFEPWILKFDGVEDDILGNTHGYGRMEYAYYKMATEAGITMSPCRLLEENGRAHFMTRRFDRNDNEKIHMQSLCALGHFDFNLAGEYGYEEVFNIILQLNLGYEAMQEMYRRMVFNVLARNQDDHTRNIGFLMDKKGAWRLSPAYDVIWAYNPQGEWTNRHQMSINGKRHAFTIHDLEAIAERYDILGAKKIRIDVAKAVSQWPRFAHTAGMDEKNIKRIQESHRRINNKTGKLEE